MPLQSDGWKAGLPTWTVWKDKWEEEGPYFHLYNEPSDELHEIFLLTKLVDAGEPGLGS